MAKQIKNEKNFLILKVDKADMNRINSPGICDSCSVNMQEGYYIAALNHINCEHCYNEWLASARVYPSDRHIEERRFAIYNKAFNELSDNT